MLRRPGGIAIVLGLLAAVLPLRAGAQGRHWLPAVTLQHTDLPHGSVAGTHRFWTDAQAANRDHVPVALYRRHGRLLSYENNFARPLLHGLEIFGRVVILSAGSEITRFRGPGGARWYFGRLRTATRHSGVYGSTTMGTRFGLAKHLSPYRRSPNPKVGNQSAAFTAAWAADEFAYTTRTILFRQGRYVVFLRIDGLQTRIPRHVAIALAARIDQRIRATT